MAKNVEVLFVACVVSHLAKAGPSTLLFHWTEPWYVVVIKRDRKKAIAAGKLAIDLTDPNNNNDNWDSILDER